MIDTVKFWIDTGKMSRGNPFDILPYLSDIGERNDVRRGYSCIGRFGNFTVSIFKSGVSLIGSLAKYHLGDNVQTLTRSTVQTAIEQMSDNLHTDIGLAKVTRLDISTVIPTTLPPSNYYNYLGIKPRFERVQTTPDTLYYNNGKNPKTMKLQLAFYDKIKEAKTKKAPIPQSFKNLLRYELRFLRRLPSQFNVEVTGAILHNSDFYAEMIRQWHDEFSTILKNKKIDMVTDMIKKPSDVTKALATMYLQEKGQAETERILADLRASNAFADPKYYSRTKLNLNRLITVKNEQKNESILELENKIYDVAKYAQ